MDLAAFIALGLGVVALFFGRRLVWLAVAFAGAWGALLLIDGFGLDEGWVDSTRWLVAAVVGLLLALLTRTVTKAGTAVAGFVLAAAFVVPALEGFGLVADAGEVPRLVVGIVAGVIGSFVASVALKGALIGLTSAVGASAILSEGLGRFTADLEPLWFFGAFAVLALAGVLYQFRHA